ncbi:MAG: DUF1569 domain-containing protein [Thermoanaerobaculia bacterium]|jgi:hypothetical protein
MNSLLNEADRDALLRRIETLQPAASRQWGKMNSAQMLAHLCVAMNDATGGRPAKQSFLGKIVTPLIRSSIFGEKPFGKNAPTDPTYVVSDEHDFAAERLRLVALINRFAERGTLGATGQMHPFFGKLTAEEWGKLTWKHIDHHLRQFGV